MKKYRSNSKSKSAIMKHFILTAIFAAMCSHGAAQTTEEVATGLSNPIGLHIVGTNLYVAESGNRRISKINLVTIPEVKTTQFVSIDVNFINPRGFASKGTDLYIAAGVTISKIDLNNTPSTSLDSIYQSALDLVGVNDIVFNGNTLYAVASVLNKIVKIADVTIDNRVVSNFITGISIPRGLLLSGTDLYVTSGNAGGKLSKIDLTADTLVAVDYLTGLHTPTHMALEGNNLYISERGTGKIVKIDISETTPTKTDVLMGLIVPQGLAIYNGYLYIVHGGSNDVGDALGKIVKYPVSPTVRPGSFTLDTQGKIDGILDGNFIGFAEDLIIKEATPGTIISLAGLANITSIGGNLQILGNTSLVSLEGLEGLETLGGVQIGTTDGTAMDGNAALVGFCAISSFVTGNTPQVATTAYFVANNGYNPTYAQFGDAATCTTTMAGDLILGDQAAINGVASIFTRIAGNLIIKETAPGNITSLTGLANIISIGGNLEIVGNTLLTNLEGLEDLVVLEGKLYIGTTDGTDMDANAALVNFCAISNLVTGTAQITNVSGETEYFVANNGYDPTYAQLGEAITCTNTIHAGNLTLNTQAAINGVASNFTRIEGDLMISGTDTNTITSLAGLSNIISIGGNLEIVGNTSLTSLEGLGDLAILEGKLYIGITAAGVSNANAALVNYCAISSLVTGTAQIIDTDVPATNKYFVGNNGYNPTYAQLGDAATCSTTMPGDLVLGDQAAINAALATSFTSIQTDLKIEETTTGSITSLLGLSKITSIGGNLEIIGTTALINLSGLGSITTLGGKLYIGITAADGTTADANTALVNFCAISGLVTGDSPQITNASATNEYFVENNEYNPSYAGLAIGSAATTDGGVDGCREFGAVVSTNTFSKDRYRLFPNPVKDILFIKSESEITSISISNVSGQAVLKGKGGNIDVRNLSKGIYFAKIVSGEKVTVEKFIKM